MEERQIEVRPRNWLIPVLLLELQEKESYGYELMERMANFGLDAKHPGTVYRTLRQLEQEGKVRSSWEASGSGPARRMYRITDLGEASLNSWASTLRQCQRDMEAFLRVYHRQAPA